MKKEISKTLIYIATFCTYFSNAQKISWANEIVHTTEKFESYDNNVDHMLGMPSIYQGVMNGNIDPFSEGYILYNNPTGKKNIITLGFAKTIIAEQLVIGGVMNMGTIKSIYVINPKGKKQEIYQMMKGSVSKFHNFNIYFEPREVTAVEITIDHQKVNNWNIIKGIGLVNSNNLLDLQPEIFTEDEFYGKEEFIIYNDKKEKCISFNPKLSHDEKQLYYVKECENSQHQDIWIATVNDKGGWTEGILAPAPLNNEAHNFVASVGLNGKFLILGNAYNKDGTSAGDGVSISHKQPDGTWGIPETIKIPKLINKNDHANFYMASSEKVIVMAIEDSNTVGNLDLYASIKNVDANTWSTPINLGRSINTEISEDYPFLSNDTKTLYFSSNGYIGFGGYDIYMTQRLDDTWQYWSKPLNLGPLVNSKVDDCGFSLSASGNHAFYHTPNTSSDTAKKMDIFRVIIPKILRQEAKATIKGTVKSMEDSAKYTGSIKIFNVKGESVSSNEIRENDEFYNLAVPLGKMYKMTVELENHFKKDILLDFVDSTENLKQIRHIRLEQYADSGHVVKLPKITFDATNKTVLSVLGLDIDSLVKKILLQKNSKIEIRIAENSLPDKTQNSKLAATKASAISTYLIKKGISQDKFMVIYTAPNIELANKKETPKSTKKGQKKEIKKSEYSIVYLQKLTKTNTANQYIRN